MAGTRGCAPTWRRAAPPTFQVAMLTHVDMDEPPVFVDSVTVCFLGGTKGSDPKNGAKDGHVQKYTVPDAWFPRF